MQNEVGKKVYSKLLIVLAVLAALLVYLYASSAPAQSRESAEVPVYGAIPVNPGKIAVSDSFVGYVTPIHSVAVVPYINGFLDRILVEGGQEVKAGDTLIVIKQDEYKARLDAAKAQVLQAQANFNNARLYYNRTKKAGARAVSKTELDNAKASYLSAEAALAQAKADRIASEGNLQASKAIYARVIGQAPKDVSTPKNLNDFIPASFEEALEYTKANNYSIRYAKDLLNSRTYNVAANNGALLPSITLDGSATTSKGDASNNGLYNRDTKVDEVQWGVNMNIPLYTAGETRAKIRQSKYQKWQAQELVLEAERQAISDVTSAWELMTSNRAQIKSIQDQVKANEIALDGVQKEEALGNRTILDVLDAYQELLNSNVNEVKARRDYYVAAMQVLLSMGKLTAENLKLNVELYEPKKFYKETRDKWLSLSID